MEVQNREQPAELWNEGVEDYLTHAKELLSEFADVIDEEKDGSGQEDEVGLCSDCPHLSTHICSEYNSEGYAISSATGSSITLENGLPQRQCGSMCQHLQGRGVRR